MLNLQLRRRRATPRAAQTRDEALGLGSEPTSALNSKEGDLPSSVLQSKMHCHRNLWRIQVAFSLLLCGAPPC